MGIFSFTSPSNKSHYTPPKYPVTLRSQSPTLDLERKVLDIVWYNPLRCNMPSGIKEIEYVLDDEGVEIDHRSTGSKGKLPFYDTLCWRSNSELSISVDREDVLKVLAYTSHHWHGCDVFIHYLCAAGQVRQRRDSANSKTAGYETTSSSNAAQRGFDGYLLNFECPLLQSGVEQTRVLAACITLLKKGLRDKVGMHAEVVWYNSVIFTVFTNYTWRPTYSNLTMQYFLSLESSLTANKTLRNIYMGMAIFAHAWTWESEQDKGDWIREKWWDYGILLWAGPRKVIAKLNDTVLSGMSRPTRYEGSGRKDHEGEDEEDYTEPVNAST
ncbi:hypothetical protein K435DRAFT_809465 [Dendrothele bispora CBS 962.96]|uniref:Cytosolic endo-beta-N-acetylglucosaminidase TIM barrel domain-containing protein n=1 Tax=Dendrothele bispora (strain CBS 962.96) TaxID=1314807 RepID=A0A4S8KY62_DENBC|nr:hypothetical protein K435DRAFT_809465 [Dendrothele bispora CBS 962.96]